jgi:hypothetical protein
VAGRVGVAAGEHVIQGQLGVSGLPFVQRDGEQGAALQGHRAYLARVAEQEHLLGGRPAEAPEEVDFAVVQLGSEERSGRGL